MGKRVRLSDDSLNSHGSRVLTRGVDTGQYERNPVLLYMHERGKVIGYMKDIEVSDHEITGEPVFDCASELSRQCKQQWDVGSLRMVSIGIDVVELSEAPEHLVPGQTSPTITKSKLYEASIVDIGANDNAIVMRRDGIQITLGRGSSNPLPELKRQTNKQQEEMELKTIAKKLDLPEAADESAVLAKIDELREGAAEAARLKKEKERIETAQIEAEVEAAVKDGRVPAGKKEHFVKVGKQTGIESLRETLGSMTPHVRLSSLLKGGERGENSRGERTSGGKYAKLSEVPEAEVLRLRDEDPEEYRRLYKAEYGFDIEGRE